MESEIHREIHRAEIKVKNRWLTISVEIVISQASPSGYF